ncbi:MAG: redox-regulated ATPase YchF [Bacilli bacterium]|jgi:GTP-binding protein YchF|nr:redox-regulated ATPase YchF [Acholeplasmataceae bacterium]
MAVTAGIVGLPNVGKSTLFNAITKAQALSANYPFATIESNVGVVEINDERLNEIARIINPRSVVPTSFSFTDIAGLVKGASKGEGLGNQFLANIREVDAICQVVRCFDDKNIIHVEGGVDPIRDIEIINLELVLADLEIIERRLPKIEKRAQLKDKEAEYEYHILKRIYDALLDNIPARMVDLTGEEKAFIKNFNFLTLKPVLYVANVDEASIIDGNEYTELVKAQAEKDGSKVVIISARIEEELSELEDEERKMFLADLGISESGLDKLVKETYSLLGLATFFTAGEKECKAWTFKKGMKAPDCAGIIHTDFKRGFIRAEVYHYDDLIAYQSPLKVKEAGKVRSEGKEYVVQDGDIILFRFNV